MTNQIKHPMRKMLISFTFHIVLQNDNPLVTMSFDPDHLKTHSIITIKQNVEKRLNCKI